MGCEGAPQRGQDQAQKNPQPGKDASEVVADGGEDGVGGGAGGALEIATAEMAFGVRVSDYGLDGGTASQPAFAGAEHAALLAGAEDPAWVRGVVAAVSLVDLRALDLPPGVPPG